MNLDGSDIKLVLPYSPEHYGEGPTEPTWSPDQSHIAYTIPPTTGKNPPCNYNRTIYVSDSAGGAQHQLVPTRTCGTYDHQATWSPDGTLIAYTETSERGPTISQIRVVRPDGTGDHAVTTPTPDGLCTDQNNCPYNLGDHEPAFSPDSHQLVYTGIRRTGSGIFTINADGTAEHRLFADEFDCRLDPISHPSWSPDGHRIVFTLYPDGPTTSDLYIIEVSGTGLRRLTTHAPFYEQSFSSTHRCTPSGAAADRPEMNTSPVWAADGTTIVYVTNRYHLKDCSGPEIDSIRADGTGPTRLTRHNPGPPLPPGCHPDPNDIREASPAV